jgi:site-specific recombinase XerD
LTTRGKKFPPETLGRGEVTSILEACGPPGNPYAERHRALIVLMWRSGLRLAEALALRPGDIDRDALAIRVLHGKGDKARTTATDEQALEVIENWLKIRAAKWKITDHHLPIICTRSGETIKQSYIRRKLPEIAKTAGVEKRTHAHVFRHTFAVELSRSGVPVHDIQVLLGHSSLATTSIYLSSLSPEESLNHLRKRKW